MSIELEREIERLRERVDEAEQMRRAIVRAEVDGFVIGEGDAERRVQLLNTAQSRDLVERSRRLEAFDEHTRRFLGMLAVETLQILDTMRASLDTLRRREPGGESRHAIDSMERQIAILQRLAEDLRRINPTD